MERTIIHLNIADFSVAVERLLDSSLKTKPLIIAEPSARAMVYDMSDEAYAEGVRKGMLLGNARRRCRSALVLPPRPEQYCRALNRCLEQALHYTPLVERSTGNGHLYLDVTGTHRLFGPPPDIGWRLRNTLRRDLGLDPIWSVAPNKLVAKVASRLVKPRGEYIVGGGEETPFLAPLPLQLLPGVTASDLLRLQHVNIQRVHQALPLSMQELSVLCEGRARFLYQAIRGIDPAPVLPGNGPVNQCTRQHVFTPDTNQEVVVRAALTSLVQQAGAILRERGLGCCRLTVSLMYTDGINASRHITAKTAVNDEPGLLQLAIQTLYRCWHRRTRLRQITLTCSQLRHPVRQLSLFTAPDPGEQTNNQISAACDAIRARCGGTKIVRGSQLPLITTRLPPQ